MSSLGFAWVRELLAGLPGVECELAVLPEERGRLLSMPGNAPLNEFDLVAFSSSFELDHLNVAAMLSASGIAPLAAERGSGAPYVLAGGIAAALNPEPLAGLMDALLLGEAEALLPALGPLLAQGIDRQERERWLTELAALPGAYVPRFYSWSEQTGHAAAAGPARRIAYQRLAAAPERVPCSPLRTPEGEFGDALIVEVGRGCGRGCRFCAAGWLYRPVRFQPGERLERALESALEPGRRVGLLGTAVSDHPQINALIERLSAAGHRVSLSSIRAGSLDERDYAALAASGLGQIALAPEAGSERLRRALNKRISDAEFAAEAERIGRAGIRRIKLYFMTGLPFEQQQDLEAVAALARSVKAAGGRRLSVAVSLTPFVPKPHTPLQWHPFAPPDRHSAAAALVRRLLANDKGIALSAESGRMAQIQALLARGDRGLARLLLAAGSGIGPALRAWGGDIDRETGRQRARDEHLPWEIVDAGLDYDELYRQYQALSGEGGP